MCVCVFFPRCFVGCTPAPETHTQPPGKEHRGELLPSSCFKSWLLVSRAALRERPHLVCLLWISNFKTHHRQHHTERALRRARKLRAGVAGALRWRGVRKDSRTTRRSCRSVKTFWLNTRCVREGKRQQALRVPVREHAARVHAYPVSTAAAVAFPPSRVVVAVIDACVSIPSAQWPLYLSVNMVCSTQQVQFWYSSYLSLLQLVRRQQPGFLTPTATAAVAAHRTTVWRRSGH